MKYIHVYQISTFVCIAMILVSMETTLAQNSGVLYGMTSEGGTTDEGTIFSYNTTTGTFTDLFNFNRTDGWYPTGSLYEANDGLLYGMTYGGGTYDAGVLFRFDPITEEYTLLVNFDPSVAGTGSSPLGNVMQASNGLLYGMTSSGGNDPIQDGVLFSYDPVHEVYKNLIQFGNDITGSEPNGSLVDGKNGLLYGTTVLGGAYNKGSIFSFNPVTNVATVLVNFNDSDGAHPYGSLYLASNNLFYGTTRDGVKEDGNLFSFDPVTHAISTIVTFNGQNGQQPTSDVIQASNGLLYGTATYGGGGGGIYLVNLNTNIEDFSTLGVNTTSDFLQASDGLLYSMTEDGSSDGSTNYGSMFSLSPVDDSLKVLHDFDGTNGAAPHGNLIEYHSVTGVSAITTPDMITLLPSVVSEHVSISFHAPTRPTLKIMDMLGRIWYAVEQQSPTDVTEVNVSNWPCGQYVVLIAAGNEIETRKMEIIR